MTEKFTLSATKREVGKAARRESREAGNVLAVMYGHGVDPVAIAIDASAALRMYRKAGTSGLIELQLDGKKIPVIIKTVDIHPVRHELAHMDFLAVNEKEATVVTIPINYIGESAAVKLGGTFIAKYHAIDIRCLPTEIPASFELDISSLKNMNDHLSVSDLNIDEKKFEIMGLAPEIIICSVAGYSEDVADETQSVDVEVTGEKESE
jgi:large subunit ribosomal protein L25